MDALILFEDEFSPMVAGVTVLDRLVVALHRGGCRRITIRGRRWSPALRRSEAQKRLTEKTFIEQLRAKGARIAELQAFQRELEQVVHRMSRAQGPTPHREWDQTAAKAPASHDRTPLRSNYR